MTLRSTTLAGLLAALLLVGCAPPAPDADSRPVAPREAARVAPLLADQVAEEEIGGPDPPRPAADPGTEEPPAAATARDPEEPPGRVPQALHEEAPPDSWLARHQSADGSWDGARFHLRCVGEPCTGRTEGNHVAGDTGLCLLVFFAQGETHRTPRYGSVVKGGLAFLQRSQDGEGCFGPREGPGWLEDQALAALAMAEGWGMTQSPVFQHPAMRGVEFLERCRDPYLAWRYGARPGPRDVETTTWALMALRSARNGGILPEGAAFAEVLAWFEERTDPETGRLGAGGGGGEGERGKEVDAAATAMGMLARALCSDPPRSPGRMRGADLLLARLPLRPEGSLSWDPLLEYMGTLAMFHGGGRDWRTWSQARRGEVGAAALGRERECAAGSFDPPPAGPRAGIGRLRATALGLLTLDSANGYRRVGEDED